MSAEITSEEVKVSDLEREAGKFSTNGSKLSQEISMFRDNMNSVHTRSRAILHEAGYFSLGNKSLGNYFGLGSSAASTLQVSILWVSSNFG